MSSRVVPIILAITSVAVRLTGDEASADILALAALGTVTISLQRAPRLQAAAAGVRSYAALLEKGARNRKTT